MNIGAFNLGNALGAWLGGAVIEHGPGLGAVTWVAALVTLSGLVLAMWAARLDRPPRLSTHGGADASNEDDAAAACAAV